MKTAIASTGSAPDASIDRHFGRCPFFFVYDDATGKVIHMENPAKEQPNCKGDVIVRMFAREGITRVIAGDFGTKVQRLLVDGKIQMVIIADENVRVSDILFMLTQSSKAMPKMDKTGPEQQGPRSGRTLGKCPGKSGTYSGESFELGKGMGMKRKTGGGKGRGRRLQSGLPLHLQKSSPRKKNSGDGNDRNDIDQEK